MDSGSSDSSRRREELLAPLYEKHLGIDTMPVVNCGFLKFASVDSQGKPNLTSFRLTASSSSPAASSSSLATSDGVWCELFADPFVAESRLAVYRPSARGREDAGSDPVEILTFHWKTKALRMNTVAGPSGSPVHYFVVTYLFSAVHDPRFRSSASSSSSSQQQQQQQRKFERLDRVALVVPSEPAMGEWFQKLRAALEIIPPPVWMGPLKKKPTKSSALRRDISRAKKRFFVLDGANMIYYATNKLVDEKGKLTLTKDATVSREQSQSGTPNFTLRVGTRTLVAESLQTDPQLQLQDVENWVLKIQQTIEALAELEAQMEAEELQPHPVGAPGSRSSGGGGGGGPGDPNDDHYYDDDGNPVEARDRDSGGHGLALGLSVGLNNDGGGGDDNNTHSHNGYFDGWAQVYPFLASPKIPRWTLRRIGVRGGTMRNVAGEGVDLALTSMCTVVDNASVSGGSAAAKELGVEVAHPRGLFFLRGYEGDDGAGGARAPTPSPVAHRRLAQQLQKQLLDLRYARREIVDPYAFANATTHFLVMEDVEVHMSTRCNVLVAWYVASEPEFRQSTGVRLGTAHASWPARRKYALNTGHSSAAAESSSLMVEVLLVEPSDDMNSTSVSAGGLLSESTTDHRGVVKPTQSFAYVRGNFQYDIPLGDLDYSYADEAKPVRTTVQFGKGQSLSFRAFLEPQHLLSVNGISFVAVAADDGAPETPSDQTLANKFMATVAGYQLSVQDVGAEVCNLYTQAGPRELTPAGELIRATATMSGASRSPQFQPFSFRLGQIAEGTRLKFAFIDQRGRIAGLATVPGAALLRAVTTRQPATIFVDLRKQRPGAARVKMSVHFSRDQNFERDFKGTLESRAQQAKHRQQHGIAASFVALSEAAVDNAKGAGIASDDAPGQQRRQSLLLPSAQVTRYESWITKLPRSSRGFAPPKQGQHSGSSKHLGRGAKRRFLSLDNGVLRYYTNESKLDLKGQMSLFSHTEWHEVEGYEYALVVENKPPKDGSGPAMSPHAAARRPLAFLCDDQESFRCWKIALSLVKGQLLQEEAAALRGPQLPEAAVEGGGGGGGGGGRDELLGGGEEGFDGGDDGNPSTHDVADARLLEMQELARQQEARMREEEAQRQQAYAQYGQQEEALQQRQRELAEQQRRLEDMQRQWELDQQQQQQQQQQQPERGMAANPHHVSKMGGQAAVARALQDGGGVQSAASLFAAPQFSFQEPPPQQQQQQQQRRPPPPVRAPPRKLTALEEAHLRHAEDHRRKIEQLEHDRQVAAAQGIRLEAGDITTTTIVNIEPDEEDEDTKQRKRKRKWVVAGVAVLVGLLLLLLLFVVATAMARLNVVSTGVMIESDIPQLTRPPNAVSAALWLRGQAEYAFTNPGYLTVCVSHVDASMFYVDGGGGGGGGGAAASSTGGAPPTLTKITPASNIDLMFPHGGGGGGSGRRASSRPVDTCVPPYATVKLQIPFEVRVMLSPALTQSIADDCSASSQRFAVDVLGSGTAYIKSLPGIGLPTITINHVENIPCNPDAVAQGRPNSNPRLPEPQAAPSQQQQQQQPPPVATSKPKPDDKQQPLSP